MFKSFILLSFIIIIFDNVSGVEEICAVFPIIQKESLKRDYQVDIPKASEICIVQKTDDIEPNDPWNSRVTREITDDKYLTWLSTRCSSLGFHIRSLSNKICILHTSTAGTCNVSEATFLKNAPQVD